MVETAEQIRAIPKDPTAIATNRLDAITEFWGSGMKPRMGNTCAESLLANIRKHRMMATATTYRHDSIRNFLEFEQWQEMVFVTTSACLPQLEYFPKRRQIPLHLQPFAGVVCSPSILESASREDPQIHR